MKEQILIIRADVPMVTDNIFRSMRKVHQKYEVTITMEQFFAEQWIQIGGKKHIYRTSNEKTLKSVIKKLENKGLQEGEDFFLIKQNTLLGVENGKKTNNIVGIGLTTISPVLIAILEDDIQLMQSFSYCTKN